MEPRHRINAGLSRVLIAGVWAAAALCTLGVVMAAGSPHPALKPFTPVDLSSPGVVLKKAASLDPRGVMALGVLVLLATPVVRVAFSLVAFILEKDRVYAAVTVLVLGLLTVGLVFGMGE